MNTVARRTGHYSENQEKCNGEVHRAIHGAGAMKELERRCHLIPAGRFMMGSPEGEKAGFNYGEETQHEVTVSKPFYMAKYEVTQEQYEQVTGTNPSHFKGVHNPVEMVSWDDAQDFIRKLNALTGKMARLATEAEWEHACRAGTTTRFYNGDGDTALEFRLGFSWAIKSGFMKWWRGRYTRSDLFRKHACFHLLLIGIGVGEKSIITLAAYPCLLILMVNAPQNLSRRFTKRVRSSDRA